MKFVCQETARRVRDPTAGRLASMQRKKVHRRALDAGRVEDRMVKPRQPVEEQHPEHPADSARQSTVSSKVIGMNIGQLLNGRPPMLNG